MCYRFCSMRELPISWERGAGCYAEHCLSLFGRGQYMSPPYLCQSVEVMNRTCIPLLVVSFLVRSVYTVLVNGQLNCLSYPSCFKNIQNKNTGAHLAEDWPSHKSRNVIIWSFIASQLIGVPGKSCGLSYSDGWSNSPQGVDRNARGIPTW